MQTQKMNKHLHDIMDGLTAKVFRTYNASRTLEEQLEKQMSGKILFLIIHKVLQYTRIRVLDILLNRIDSPDFICSILVQYRIER